MNQNSNQQSSPTQASVPKEGMLKWLLIILAIIVLSGGIYWYFNNNKSESGRQLIVDSYSYDRENNQDLHSQETFQITEGSQISIGEEAKVLEILDEYVVLSIKPADEQQISEFNTDVCLIGDASKEYRIDNDQTLNVSSCTFDSGNTYTIKYSNGL